jgi:methionyl-tRNA formyltransferase
MRLVFMGTPEFSVATLRALIDAGHEIVCVYSQPPRPAGRGYALKKSPVQEFAEAQGIEVRTPVSLKPVEEQERFAALGVEVAVVVAYGLLLPKAVLDAPRFGCFNVHASLLPRWRGAAPIQRAIMAGDAESGVTIMRMEEGLDTGPMVKVVRVAITVETTAATLHDALMVAGAAAMVEALQVPDLPGVVQPVAGVTYAKKIDKAEARIDFSRDDISVRNHIHGLSPFPGAWLVVNGARIKVLKCRLAEGAGAAGEFIDEALTVACGSGAVQLIELQREGKGGMKAEEFMRGFAITRGSKAT